MHVDLYLSVSVFTVYAVCKNVDKYAYMYKRIGLCEFAYMHRGQKHFKKKKKEQYTKGEKKLVYR